MEVNSVNVRSSKRSWYDLRRKFQVLRSEVKKKSQEIRRKRNMTGNAENVPQLTELEVKVSSVLTDEEVEGVANYTPLGLGEVDVLEMAAEVDLSVCADDLPSGVVSAEEQEIHVPQPSKKRRIALSADLTQENARLFNANLKLQAEVLNLQKEYYKVKLANLQKHH